VRADYDRWTVGLLASRFVSTIELRLTVVTVPTVFEAAICVEDCAAGPWLRINALARCAPASEACTARIIMDFRRFDRIATPFNSNTRQKAEGVKNCHRLKGSALAVQRVTLAS